MKFRDSFFSVEDLYSLGTEIESGKPFLSVPVTTGPVDYEEYYEISEATLQEFQADPALAKAFADECRRREHDELLVQKPGWNRGTSRLG